MGRSRGRDFRLLLAATFFYGTGPTAVVPLIAGYAGELGASGVFMGIAGGLMNIVSLASRPFVGNLADRVGKRRLTICGGALMVLAGLAYTLAYLPWMVLAARVFHGIGFACCSVSLSTWISNLLPRDRVASGVGLYGMMTAVGMAIGPAAGIWLYQHAGYHVAFLVAAALMAGMVVLSFCVRDEGLVVDDGARKGHFRLIEWRVVPVTLVAMLFAIPYVATQAFIVPVAEAEGVTAPVALYFPIYAIVLVVLRLGLRRCFDRLPFYVFLFASLVCAALSLLCLSWMQGFWVMFLAAAFMAVRMVSCSPSANPRRCCWSIPVSAVWPTAPSISVLTSAWPLGRSWAASSLRIYRSAPSIWPFYRPSSSSWPFMVCGGAKAGDARTRNDEVGGAYIGFPNAPPFPLLERARPNLTLHTLPDFAQ